MSRTDELDQLYGHLVFLCDEARFLPTGPQYALMLAFNLVAELHTPSRLVVDPQLDLDDAAERAVTLTEALATHPAGIDQIVRLRTVRSLLLTVLRSWSPTARDIS